MIFATPRRGGVTGNHGVYWPKFFSDLVWGVDLGLEMTDSTREFAFFWFQIGSFDSNASDGIEDFGG